MGFIIIQCQSDTWIRYPPSAYYNEQYCIEGILQWAILHRRQITMSKYYFLQGTHWESTHYAMQCFPKRPSLSNGLCSNCSKIPQTVYNKCAIHLLCNAVWWTFTLFHSCQVLAMGFVATLTIGFTTCFAVNAWILRYVFCVGTDIVAYFS